MTATRPATTAPSDASDAGTDAATAPAARFDPRLLVVASSVAISWSSLLVALSGAAPATAALARCLLALPLLVPLAWWEWRRRPAPVQRRRALAEVGAGALLGLDFVLWGQSIADLGAGIATVLVNVQVLVVPLLARLTGERIGARFLVIAPVLLAGVGLAAGFAAPGEHTVRGALCGVAAGVAYGGYLAVLRSGSATGHRFAPVARATVGAALSSALAGLLIGGLVAVPGWGSLGWLALLAVTGQVLGWVLATAGMRRLRAAVGAALLLLQPVLAVVWGVLVLGERPGPWQLAGCVLVLGSVWLVATTRRPRRLRVRRSP